MKRAILWGLMGLAMLAGPSLFAGDNRPIGRAFTGNVFKPADATSMVRFSTTTAAANTAVCVVSTMTHLNLVDPQVSWATVTVPDINSSTTTTYGGRMYTIFQVVSSTVNVSVDFDTVNLSTTTSPYLTVGQWWSPDDPIAWQGNVCLKAPGTFTVTGWMFFDKSR